LMIAAVLRLRACGAPLVYWSGAANSPGTTGLTGGGSTGHVAASLGL
jgi:hypothetical protein